MLEHVKTLRKQPVQSRAQATCQAVEEATIQVLLHHGAGALTTTRVAERAGVSVGTLYQYFPNKRSLVETVRARYFALMSETIEKVLAQERSGDLAPLLEGAVDALLKVKRDNLDLSQALAKLSYQSSDEDFSKDVVEHFATILVPLLASKFGDFAQTRARVIVAALEGLLSYAVKNEPQWLNEGWFAEHLKKTAAQGLD